MSQPRPRGHIVFVLLSILAIPTGLAAAISAVLIGLEMHVRSFLDLAPAFAMMTCGVLFLLAAIMIPLWRFIYRDTVDRRKGYAAWFWISTIISVANATVFYGFLHRYVVWNDLPTYDAALAHVISLPGGGMLWLLFWPVAAMVAFGGLWLSTGMSKMLALPS